MTNPIRSFSSFSLSALAATPNTTEIYRLVQYFHLSYIGIPPEAPWWPNPSPACLPARISNIYFALQTSYCFSPLNRVVGYGAYRMFLFVLFTYDNLQLFFTIYSDSIDTATARPKDKALLLMGMLRALWDHCTVYHENQLLWNISLIPLWYSPSSSLYPSPIPMALWSGYMRPSSSSSTR